MHLIVSYQDLDNKSLIRILQAENVDDFQKELLDVYGENNAKTFILHFMGHFIERLIQDLKYKKFKGIDLTLVDNALWESNKSNLNWFTGTFQPFVENRINQYIDDLDEELLNQIDFKNVPWKETKVDKFIIYENTSSLINNSTERNYEQVLKERDLPLSRSQSFKLLGVFKRDDGKYIISKAHLYAMIKLYADLYVPSLVKRTIIKPDVEFNKLNIVLNSNILTLFDIENIITNIRFLNTPEFKGDISDELKWLMYLKEDADKSSVFKKLNDYSNFMPYDLDEAFKDALDKDSFYNKFVISKIPPENNKDLLNRVQLDIQTPAEKSQDFIYKNILKNTIYLSQSEIKYLKEFKKLANFDSLSTIPKTILKEFSLRSPEKIVIDELHKVLNLVLEHFKFEIPKSSQFDVTKTYVDLYKDNLKETPATLVIADVTMYLQQNNVALVNQNQIGIDLVDLGVKKTRKASGFVYGINLDTYRNLIIK